MADARKATPLPEIRKRVQAETVVNHIMNVPIEHVIRALRKSFIAARGLPKDATVRVIEGPGYSNLEFRWEVVSKGDHDDASE